nr:tail protein X [Mitsuokella multacida]
MSKYTTKSGDTWDLIAYEQMGSCSYVAKLMVANRAYVNTAIFSAGVVLTVPEIPAGETISTLPPWRR